MIAAAMATAAGLGMSGCTDSFMDPSRTGRFEAYPTSINVLDRIDAIEHDRGFFDSASSVTPQDLVPSELNYYLYPGDTVTVAIYELYTANVWATSTRRIDAGGFYRVSEVGDVRAAGLTPEQFKSEIERLVERDIMQNPQVDVIVEAAGGLRYTIYGYLSGAGVFTLQNPDLRLLDALAIAGSVPVTTERVYVIRTVPLTEAQRTIFDPARTGGATTVPPETNIDSPPVNIDDLLDDLENRPDEAPQTQPDPDASPGMLQDPAQDPVDPRDPPLVDIDALESARSPTQPPPVDVDEMRPPKPPEDASGDTFIYVEERGEWVRVRGDGDNSLAPLGAEPDPRSIVRERIIAVDYQRLARGDSSQNIVIRPDDRIYVDGPQQGFVYIDGEINRVGVYQLPQVGTLTLSRMITAAGGLGPIAVPSRVDLTRRVGPNREATITVNVGAIRNHTEPDIVLRPDDHIIIGTTFWATPLAVLRNGFRVTYGFGFLLDRNFGNDVFGAPPGEESGIF